MSDARRCLACGQPLAAGSMCSECGTDDHTLAAVRTLPLDFKRDRAVNHLFYFACTTLALFLLNQFGSAAFFSWLGGMPPNALFLWWQVSSVLMSAWFLFIAFQFSTWPMRIAQVLLTVPLLWSIWPWLQDLMGVLEMPDRIRDLGTPLSLILGRLTGIVAPFSLVAMLLLIRAFMQIARDLQLPRPRTWLGLAFWLTVVQFVVQSGDRLLNLASGNVYEYEPRWLFMASGIITSVAWLAATVLLLFASNGLRRRGRWLRPSSRPA